MAIERLAWCEISKKALVHNLNLVKEKVGPKVAVMAVVKANAYGHGAVGCSQVFLEAGAKMLGVSSYYEAKQLREAKIWAPIVILGYTPAENYYDMVQNDLIVTVKSIDVVKSLVSAARRLGKIAKVWVKVDTGMHRLGLQPGEVLYFARKLQDFPNLKFEGIFTHFAGADNPDLKFGSQQLQVFNELLKELEDEKIEVAYKSVANSAATFALTGSHFNLVRCGGALYGLKPYLKNYLKIPLEAALTFKTEIVQITEVKKGESLGYGLTFKAKRPSLIATLAVGYGDGFRRAPKNWGEVLIKGQKAPIVGFVSMDQTMVDITDLKGDIRRGEEVILVGRSNGVEMTADEVAEKLGTNNYEVTTSISVRVSRIYV